MGKLEERISSLNDRWYNFLFFVFSIAPLIKIFTSRHCFRHRNILLCYYESLSALLNHLNIYFDDRQFNVFQNCLFVYKYGQIKSITILRQVKNKLDHWVTSHRKNRRKEIVLCRIRIGHTKCNTRSTATEWTPAVV